MNEPVNIKTYSLRERNSYLVGMMGQNIIYNVVGAALAYYLQFTLLIPATIVSSLMAIGRVWDAINDPIMGTIVDKTRTKWGKCRPYLMFIPLPILVITILCFVNFGFYDPNGSGAKNFLIVAWASIMYILWDISYTIGDIPLWGITALMTEDEKDRNKLLSLARIVGGIGGGIALLAVQPVALGIGNSIAQNIGADIAGSTEAWQGLLANAENLANQFKEGLANGVPYEQLKHLLEINPTIAEATRQGERWGFLVSAILFAIVGGLLFQVVGINVKEKIKPSNKTYTLKQNFTIMWKNKPFRQILISGVLGSPKALLMLAAMPLITYYYASKDPIMAIVYMVLLGGGLFIGQFLAMGLCPRLLKKYTKKNLYNYGNLMGVIPYFAIFVVYLISPNTLTTVPMIALFFFLFFFAGASMGLNTVLQTYMIADCVDYEEYQNGVRPDGIFFSGQTFIAKMTMGIATMISGLCYSIVGFSGSEVAKVNDYISAGLLPRDNPEFSKYMMLLFFLVSIPPAIGSIITVIPTWKYCLDDKEHERILEELRKRRRLTEDKK